MEDNDPVWNSLHCTCGASGVAVMAHEPHCAVILIESLYAQLERVERETVERIKSPLFRQFLRQGFWHAHHVDLVWRYDGKDIREEADWLKDVWYAALPSTTEQQKG